MKTIKILKATKKTYWYSICIGNTYNFLDKESVIINIDKGIHKGMYVILKKDCSIIESTRAKLKKSCFLCNNTEYEGKIFDINTDYVVAENGGLVLLRDCEIVTDK